MTLTDAEAREKLAAADRNGWFPATHASQGFGILARDGREVCRCQSEKDRDEILRLAHSYDAMKAALGACRAAIATLKPSALGLGGGNHEGATNWFIRDELLSAIDAAITLARVEKQP